MFPSIEILQELIKSWTIAKTYSATRAAELLDEINRLRLEIAIDAEGRRIFYEQLEVPALAAGTYQQTKFFTKNDINYVLRRGIALLSDAAVVSAVNEGSRQRIVTREPIAWQQLFSCVQGSPLGQQTLFDFPQELFFAENETFGISIQGQIVNDGWIFYHGCTLKDTIEDVAIGELDAEIKSYVPEGQQLVPLIFRFPSNVVGTPATDPGGSDQILCAKSSRSVVLTHVSTNAPDTRISLIDEGRNQLICRNIEARGVAAEETSRFTTFYELPYPHLLRRGDRLRLEGVNGSLISGSAEVADTDFYFTFRGYPV